MRRGVCIAFVIAALLLVFSGCTKGDVDSQILENTKLIESFDYSFSNFMITYMEYEESIKDITGKIDMAENLNRNFPMPNESIKTLSKEKLEMMVEKSGTYSVNVEISGVYDYLDIKYVYTKADIVPDENNEVGIQLDVL